VFFHEKSFVLFYVDVIDMFVAIFGGNGIGSVALVALLTSSMGIGGSNSVAGVLVVA